jgi:hypothetical protein
MKPQGREQAYCGSWHRRGDQSESEVFREVCHGQNIAAASDADEFAFLYETANFLRM